VTIVGAAHIRPGTARQGAFDAADRLAAAAARSLAQRFVDEAGQVAAERSDGCCAAR
jgi:hypothetical protein